ncbi:hypothetical protein DIPPA_04370 [Diplonema papillatum]|nr:hypothetical protein DIPPA_04373 [Diplonema papillatum]KAJ9446665.1 hypothetical protein DIPPA_04374 [Diplonema papillatum]KAJ9446666.1 hypothetical protein DIPPA_04363 [Diplonema papillatum]KAJ9446667.1 hypothetical protein DIPPA_04370 [Diplonema papillatum]
MTQALAVLVLCVLVNVASGSSANFTVLAYNVAGLPELISSASSSRQSATEEISCYVNEFSIVNVQEDFNYHAALYDTCNDHAYRSKTSGGIPFGHGLNTMSRFSYTDWAFVEWNDCNGVDCLTPKGFTMARVRLAEGVYVDVYNLHTQAQTGDSDLTARRKNILQLVDYMEEQSSGNAVIVMGDTNTRYTRSGDNIRELLDLGLTDSWVELVREGSIPDADNVALLCTPTVITSASCEIVDKVLYRDNGFVGLRATMYTVRQDAYNSAGQALSDHPPVAVNFTFSTPDDRQLSDQMGGPHGTNFNDVGSLPSTAFGVSKIGIDSGSRVDGVSIELSTGTLFAHGRTSGLSTLTLAAGEYVTSAFVCSGKKGTTRIFYVKFSTSQGRSLAGGKTTSDCVTYTAPADWQIVGFHGRAGSAVDKLGVVYAPRI